MPVYAYYCRKCQKPFVAEMHLAEHEAGVPECPDCRRKDDVEKRISAFTAVTTRKSTGF